MSPLRTAKKVLPFFTKRTGNSWCHKPSDPRFSQSTPLSRNPRELIPFDYEEIPFFYKLIPFDCEMIPFYDDMITFDCEVICIDYDVSSSDYDVVCLDCEVIPFE